MSDPSLTPQVIILQAPSGTGKSTYARNLARNSSAVVVSADSYFVGADGVYRFDYDKLSAAHALCFRRYLDAVRAGYPVIVDNTNTTLAEIAPYYLGAQAYERPVSIHRLMGDWRVGAARNVHGVPMEGVQAQHDRIERCSLPPWYTLVEVEEDSYLRQPGAA